MSATMSKPRGSKVKQAAATLENDFAAIQLSFNWLGTKKSLESDERQEVANLFEATEDSVAATKKLFDTKHPAYKKLVSIKNEIRAFYIQNSLPYPEGGIRLFKRSDVEKVTGYFNQKRDELNQATEELNNCYSEMLDKAKEKLGNLFNPSDYPASLLGCFRVQWQFVNVSPPSYLMQLDPKLYEQQKQQMEAKFSEAVLLAESAFAQEFAKLVEKLRDRLGEQDDGKVKVFHYTTVTNLMEFFDRFKSLNLKSNPELDKMIEEAKQVTKGINPTTIREDFDLRKKLATNMNEIGEKLEGFMETMPRRSIVRRNNNDVEI